MAGVVGTAGLGDYCASKFAAVGFEESFRNELVRMEKTGVKTYVKNFSLLTKFESTRLLILKNRLAIIYLIRPKIAFVLSQIYWYF